MSFKKVILNEFGGPEVLHVIEIKNLPKPGPGEALIKVLAASATFTDTMVRKGIYYGFKETPPLSPGYDMVGEVVQLGQGVTGLEIGEMVADLTVFGSYSEYIVRPAAKLVPVPATLNPAEAVSMVLSYVTAYQMLHRIAKIQPGQRILVHGAGGAVGTALIELGALSNLEIYGTASKGKHDFVKNLGGIPIDYQNDDFQTRMLSIGGVDAVFDGIGGENYKRSFRSLRSGGVLVPFGFYNQAMGKGGNVALDYMTIPLWNLLPNQRRASFYSITALRDKHPEWFKEDLRALFKLLLAGKIDPVIERHMKLEEAKDAHLLIEQAAVKGRIVLDVGNQTH
jgi:NADPH:quinone reductase-like Zn-dependent oxidoreductase